MPRLISAFYRDPLHKTLDQKPYLKRYQTNELSLEDHYRHLCQLLPIYEILESKMKDLHFMFPLPRQLDELLDRSSLLKKDLAFLGKFIVLKQRETVLQASQSYIDFLKDLNPSNPDDQSKIFAHYLIRILGDLFGGQILKSYVLQLYKKKQVQSNPSIENIGVHFYDFKTNTLKDFSRWLRELEISNEDALITYGSDAYRYHIIIFDELEKTRLSSTFTFHKLQQHCCFFKQAIAVTGALVAAGLTIAAAYK